MANFIQQQRRWWLAMALAGLAVAALVFAGHPMTSSAQSMGITIQNFAFSPANDQITVGDTVTWTNNDSVAHTVTADDGSFDSGPIQPGGSFSHTFNTAGTVGYHCSIHPFMKAEVVVMSAGSSGAGQVATAPPVAQATAVPASSSSGNAAASSNGTTASAVTMPNTGAGTTSSHHMATLLLMLGAVGVLAGTGAVARRHRKSHE